MKYLTVIRHARAENPGPSEDDSSRRLTEGGVAAAFRLGQELAGKNLMPDLVVISPAVRARETAEQVCSFITGGFDTEIMPLLYTGDEQDTFEALKKLPDTKHHVFLIGHNPTFTDLINLLCGPIIENMTTGSAGCIKTPTAAWAELTRGEASLEFYIES